MCYKTGRVRTRDFTVYGKKFNLKHYNYCTITWRVDDDLRQKIGKIRYNYFQN